MIIYVNESYDSDALESLFEHVENEIDYSFYSLNEADFGDTIKQFAKKIRNKAIELARKVIAAIHNLATKIHKKVALQNEELYADPSWDGYKVLYGIEAMYRMNKSIKVKDGMGELGLFMYDIEYVNMKDLADAIANGEKDSYIEKRKFIYGDDGYNNKYTYEFLP